MIQKSSSPLYVFSHPRSGTHFLGNALALNFELDVQARHIDREYFQRDPPRFVTGSGGESDDVPWGSLVAHEQVHRFFDRVTDEVRPRLYIYRRCADVMASMFRWKMLRNHRDEELLDDPGLTFAEFLDRPLGWQESVHTRARFDFTPIEHWAFHVSGWLESGELCIRYEDLVERYDETLARIGEHFGLTRRSGSWVPVTQRVGYNPGSGGGGLDPATRAQVDEVLRRLAPFYSGAAAERPDAVEDPAMAPRHQRPLLEYSRVVFRSERRIEELQRELEEVRRTAELAERRADQLERRYHRTTRDLRAVENCLERRQAAFRDFLDRVWRESGTSQG